MVENGFTGLDFAATVVAHRAAAQRFPLMAICWHWLVAEHALPGRIFHDVMAVALLEMHPEGNLGFGQAMVPQHVDHESLAVVEEVVWNDHPVVGVAHVVAKVGRATPVHFVVQEGVLLADQPLFGDAAKEGRQPGICIDAVVEVFEGLAHYRAIA